MIQSYGDRILVRIVEKPQPKGLLLLTREEKEFQIGRVESIGADLPIFESNEGGTLEVGDYVYTRKFAGLLLEYDGVEYVSLDAKEILAFSKELK
jgi:co-chaperonin GroES (HSP10)